jgi:Zn-dependent metalloprotease
MKKSIFRSISSLLVLAMVLSLVVPVAVASTNDSTQETQYLSTDKQTNILTSLSNQLNLLNPAKQLGVTSFNQDAQGKKHILYEQRYQGIPVYGKYLYLHLNASNQVYATSKKIDDDIQNQSLNVIPNINSMDAIEQLKTNLEEDLSIEIQLGGSFGSFSNEEPTAQLVIYPSESGYVLTYQVEMHYVLPTLGNWTGFVNAHTGEVIHKINKINHGYRSVVGSGTGTDGSTRELNLLRNTSTNQHYLSDSTKEMYDGNSIDLDSYFNQDELPNQGIISTLDFNSIFTDSIYPITSESSSGFIDSDAVDAHYFASQVYDFYYDNYGRDSIDGEGMDIISFVHVPDPEGYPLDNAFWNGSFMFYGDGNTLFDCLSCSNDVVAHEITHGVTQYTAGLNYENQSGALNESISDIMAAVFDADDWTIGEETSDVPLRDLSNPNSGGFDPQPKHMDEYVSLPNTEEGDWGGVHVNSGIPNHAAYLIATDLDTAGYQGRKILGHITYNALVNYLFPSADFYDAKKAFILAVDDLDLSDSQKNEVRAIVDNAWSAVGVEFVVLDADRYLNDVNQSIEVTYSETVTESVYFDQIALLSGEVQIPLTASINNTFLTIDPVNPLEHGVTYDVYVPSGALADTQGNWSIGYILPITVDTELPTWPSNSLTAAEKTTSSVTLHWTAASDNLGIKNYVVLNAENQELATVTSDVYDSYYEINGLNDNTEYTFALKAVDWAGNETENNLSVTVTTNRESSGGGGFVIIPQEPEKESITITPDEAALLEDIESDNAQEIKINAKTENDVDKLIVELSKDIFTKATDKNKVITIESNTATFVIQPGTVDLTGLEGKVLFTSKNVTNDDPSLTKKLAGGKAASSVFEFHFEVGNKAITKFNKPISINISLNSDQITDKHKVGVYYYNETSGAWDYIGGSLISNSSITFETDHFSKYAALEYNKTFVDIKGHWAQKDIEIMASKHIAKGISDDKFAPNESITRAEFTALISRALRLNEHSDVKFTDVSKGKWYEKDINAAYTAGLVSGMEEDIFAPNLPINREQLALILVKSYAKAKGVKVEELVVTKQANFSDQNAMANWSKNFIDLAVSLELISGRTDGSFDPKGNATRAEAISVLKRLLDKIE